MPPLRNARRERFCLGLSEGKTATEAYETAGYKPCRKNASRLTTSDDIRARQPSFKQPPKKPPRLPSKASWRNWKTPDYAQIHSIC